MSSPSQEQRQAQTEGVRGDEASHDTRRPGQTVESVTRAVNILNAFASGLSNPTLAKLSRHLALPRSSTLALCNTLVRTGLLIRDTDDTYRLGPHVLELSRAYLAKTDLPGEFDRLCRELDVLPDQTLVLSVLNETDVVYIGRRRGSRPIGVSYELGMRLPAHCTASGKALLCVLSSEQVRAAYRAYPDRLPTLTPKSITRLDVLIRHLEETARRGYAVDDEETALGMACVGAPIFDAGGDAVGAVAVSLVKAALTPDELAVAAAHLCRLATHISTAVGGQRAAASWPAAPSE
jgi:IclR family transcriptional regulator, blcABC operon repressor